MPLGGRTATGSSIAPWRAIGEAGGATGIRTAGRQAQQIRPVAAAGSLAVCQGVPGRRRAPLFSYGSARTPTLPGLP